MYTAFHSMVPSDAELAAQALNEESTYRFPFFSANEAVTLGLSLRKRFRASTRYNKGKGMVISVQSIAGHPLFSCTVGDLGSVSGVGDVSLDSWTVLEGMVSLVKRTGHSTYYVEKATGAMAKSSPPLDVEPKIHGGAFPIWLENALCCPIGIVACYSGSSQDDHHLVVTGIKDYLKKLKKAETESYAVSEARHIPEQHAYNETLNPEYQSSEWVTTEGERRSSKLSYASSEEERRR